MTFADARDLAIKFGAAVPEKTHHATQCWIDRIAWLPSAAERGPVALREAIEEANRYA
jgi:hypothetical protein